MNIPFVDLKEQYQSIKTEIDVAISSIIDQASFIGGENIDSFESNFAAHNGVSHCVSCANGTDAETQGVAG